VISVDVRHQIGGDRGEGVERKEGRKKTKQSQKLHPFTSATLGTKGAMKISAGEKLCVHLPIHRGRWIPQEKAGVERKK